MITFFFLDTTPFYFLVCICNLYPFGIICILDLDLWICNSNLGFELVFSFISFFSLNDLESVKKIPLQTIIIHYSLAFSACLLSDKTQDNMKYWETWVLPVRDWSVPLGKRLSSSKRAKRPIGFMRNISKTGRLSSKSTSTPSTPSASYSCWKNKYKIRNVRSTRNLIKTWIFLVISPSKTIKFIVFRYFKNLLLGAGWPKCCKMESTNCVQILFKIFCFHFILMLLGKVWIHLYQ